MTRGGGRSAAAETEAAIAALKAIKLSDAERDSLWERQLAVLNSGFLATMAHLDNADTDEAARAFDRCGSAARLIQTRLGGNVPKRFAYHRQWPQWCDDLTLYAAGIERSLAAGNAALARDGLRHLREHFYELHRLGGTMRVNNWIYALRLALQGDTPKAPDLQSIRQSLLQAEPTAAAKAASAEYQNAVAALAQQIDQAAADGAVDAAELQGLRSANNRLLRQYGMSLE